MSFSKFVEVGRICRVGYGSDYGKVAAIVDIVDHNRVLIDSPNGVERQSIPLKRVTLTNIVVRIDRGARTATLTKAWEAQKIQEQWENSNLGKKTILAAKKANLTDMERFKLTLARQKRSVVLATKLNAAKKSLKL